MIVIVLNAKERKKEKKKSAVFDKINGYLTIHRNPKHILKHA